MEWNKDTIRAFRKKKLGLTQYQFAEVMGTSRALISNWETGKQNPCGMSQKFLTLLASIDTKKDIREFLSLEQKESGISGDTIRAFREKLGLSQTEFAEKLGRDHSTVSYWESEEISPGKKSFQALKKLAEEEGISLEELGKETESSSSEDCSGDGGCSGSEKSAPQDNRSYNIGGANFSADSKNFSSGPEIKAVASGIDILCYSFYVDVNEKVLNLLETEKSKALYHAVSYGASEIPINIGDYTFNLSAYSEGVYAYVLSNSDLRIKVSEYEECSHPSVYVKFKSLFILENGAECAVDEVRDFVSSNFGEIEQEKLSLVEMYCDLVGVNLSRDDIDKFVSRASGRATYEENGKFTGFTFGAGSIIGKVYNKTVEIKTSHKEHLFDIWEIKEDETVWRIEFELKRRILKDFGVESFSDFEEVSGDIWKYLTEKWLSMREEDSSNQSRRTLTLLWEVVQGAREFFSPVTGKVREKKRSSDQEQLVSQMKGCFTSVAAIRLSEGLSFSSKELHKEIDFEIDKQLAGVDGEKDFSREDISALSEIGLYQEAYGKAVSL